MTLEVAQQLGADLNKKIPVPYYYQIAQILRETIEDIDLEAVDEEIVLPPEAELAEMFDVARGTVRRALAFLEEEGLIYRERGRGTFVRRKRVELDVTRLSSTSEDMRTRGWEPASRVLSVKRITPRHLVASALQASDDELVWELHRLRLGDGEPISLQWSYVPCATAPDLDQHDLSGSLYYMLKNEYGIFLESADQVIRTRSATELEAELLEIHEGAPLFVITRTSYDDDGEPVEYVNALWRGDRYDLRVHLTGRR